MGSVRAVTNAAGNLIAGYAYDPYGRRTVLSGSAADSDFGYTGHFTHQATGLALAPYRAYDANIGRWLSRDPIGEAGGLNLYAYVGGNPVNAVDPLGLAPCYESGMRIICPGDGQKPPGNGSPTEGPLSPLPLSGMSCETRCNTLVGIACSAAASRGGAAAWAACKAVVYEACKESCDKNCEK